MNELPQSSAELDATEKQTCIIKITADQLSIDEPDSIVCSSNYSLTLLNILKLQEGNLSSIQTVCPSSTFRVYYFRKSYSRRGSFLFESKNF